MYLGRTQSALRTYFEDMERVQEEIWRGINVKGKTVIDVGVGYSTKKLIELGARVVGVDNDLSKIASSMNIPIVVCDFLNFPFQSRIADMVVFYFTLHEINPNFHLHALSIAGKIAPQVVVVEPLPNGCLEYEEFARIWRNAMRSIGKFEEYKTPEYWENILKKAGFRITLKRVVSWRATIPPEVLKDIVRTTVREWKRKRVAERWIRALQTKFLEESPKMMWSDIFVVIGRRV